MGDRHRGKGATDGTQTVMLTDAVPLVVLIDHRQQVISGFIADFYCRAPGLIVEVDNSQHLPECDAILRAHSFRLLRFSNRAIREDLDDVVTEFRAALA